MFSKMIQWLLCDRSNALKGYRMVRSCSSSLLRLISSRSNCIVTFKSAKILRSQQKAFAALLARSYIQEDGPITQQTETKEGGRKRSKCAGSSETGIMLHSSRLG